MRKISRRKTTSLVGFLLFYSNVVLAQTVNNSVGQPIIVPSQSTVYNQNSVFLPTPPSVHGQDIVRGADGVSCQSSVSSGGPYFDLGLIGSQDVFNRDTAAVYGRVVVPIGKRPKRLDCSKLYELEISRMKMEIDMMRLGMPVVEYAEESVSALGRPIRAANAAAPTAQLELPEKADAAGQNLAGGRKNLVIPPFDRPLPPPPKTADFTSTSGESAIAAQAKAVSLNIVENQSKPSMNGAAQNQFAPLVLLEGTEQQQPDCQFFAQIGAFADLENAKLKLLQTTYSLDAEAKKLIERRGAIVRPVERDAKKLYRLVLGPMTNAEAAMICDKMASSCFAVRRK